MPRSSFDRHDTARRRRRRVTAVLVAALTAAGLTVGPAAPAQAVACGGSAQNGLTISAGHDAVFYTDLGAGFDAAYLGYRIANSGSARTNLWVAVGGFTGGSVALADTAAARRQIASLAGGASASSFFLTKASAVTAAAQTHTVTVYDRRPDLTGATTLASCDFTFTSVASTIGANANKVTAIGSAPSSPSIGETVTVTVDGQTGTTSGAVWVSPAAQSSWPARSLRLEATTLAVDTDGNGTADQTYTDQLFIPANIASLYTSQTTYRATYVFRVTGATSTNPTIKPVAQISSGGQFKHTGSYPTLPAIASSGATASIALAKTLPVGVAGLPTTTSPNGVGGATTYAEVPYRITGSVSGGGTAVVDEYVDVPATGMIFKAGSATLTDAAGNASAVTGDPSGSTADTGARAGALHFTGPFSATSGTAARIDYTMYVPLTAGSYANQAFATINGTTIGASASSVPTVTVTANGSTLTGSSTGTSGSGTAAQTITFAAPSDVALATGSRTVTATSTSGLTVAFTGSTPSVCTVSGSTVTLVSAGTCTLSATQAGDATWAAAASVTRSFQISALSPQTVTFAQPADVTLADGNTTLTATASSGLAVSFGSATPGVCTVSGTTLTLVSAGTCTVTADQAGGSGYSPAATVTRSLQVTVLPAQTITFAAPVDTVLLPSTRTVSAASSSGLTVTVTSSTTGVCTVSGTTLTLVATGTCTLAADQAGNGSYAAASTVTRSFTVDRAPQTITFGQPADVPVLPSPITAAASADSGLAVAFTSSTTGVCTVSGTTVTLVAVGTCTMSADQPGTSVYAAATTATRSFAVTTVPQTISFADPGTVGLAAGTVPLSATAVSGLTVSFTGSTPAVCTVAGTTVTLVSDGTCTMTADQLGDSTYAAAAPVTRSFTVTPVPSLPASPAPTPTPTPAPTLSPTPSAPPVVTTGGGQQSATVTVPTGGSVTITAPGAAAGATPTVVVLPGQGTYTLDPATGTITFTPAPGFVGTPDPVTYQVSVGSQVSTATYTPTVVAVAMPPASGGAVRGLPVTVTPRGSLGGPAIVPGSVRLVALDGRVATTVTVLSKGRYDVDTASGAVTFWPLPAFAGTASVLYRVIDVEGTMLESTLVTQLEEWAPAAGTAIVDAGATASVVVTGIPAGAVLSVPRTVAGAGAVSWSRGRVHLATRPGDAGRVRVPVTVTNGVSTQRTDAVITVRPAAPSDRRFAVIDGGRTVVRWSWPAGTPRRAVTVTVGGRTACRSSGRFCVVPAVLGPADGVRLVATAAGLSSRPAAATHRASGCVRVGAVYFGVDSSRLTPATRARLDRLATVLAGGGFGSACLTGHTDGSAGDAYNLALSARRVQAVSQYLRAHTRSIRFSLRYVGERSPALPEDGGAGRAANRRVEIAVG